MKAKYKRLIEIKPNGESIGKQSEDEIFYQYHTLKYEIISAGRKANATAIHSGSMLHCSGQTGGNNHSLA